MEILSQKIEIPEGCNLILGQSHFIKTVEDIYETLSESSPSIKFGLAFCEASGNCLVRTEGNDPELEKLAGEQALKLGCGHSFLIFLRNSFPVNVLNRVKAVSEVCGVYCATANPVEVILADSGNARGILGVLDGFKSKGVEGNEDKRERKELLRKFGYKL